MQCSACLVSVKSSLTIQCCLLGHMVVISLLSRDSVSVFTQVPLLPRLQQHSLPWLHRQPHRHPHLPRLRQHPQVLPRLDTLLKHTCVDWFACVSQTMPKAAKCLICWCLPGFCIQPGFRICVRSHLDNCFQQMKAMLRHQRSMQLWTELKIFHDM